MRIAEVVLSLSYRPSCESTAPAADGAVALIRQFNGELPYNKGADFQSLPYIGCILFLVRSRLRLLSRACLRFAAYGIILTLFPDRRTDEKLEETA